MSYTKESIYRRKTRAHAAKKRARKQWQHLREIKSKQEIRQIMLMGRR